MTQSFVLFLVWALTANILAMIPSRDHHWQRAYFLIAVGIPLLIYIAVENGPIVAALTLLAGMSVLRWPLIYLTRWIKRKFGVNDVDA